MKNTVEEYVENKSIWCDGGHSASGHPRVYLKISSYEGFIVCPYCSKKFVLKG